MTVEKANQVLHFAESLASPKQTSKKRLLSDYWGILENSPNFNDDPVEWQRQVRNVLL